MKKRKKTVQFTAPATPDSVSTKLKHTERELLFALLVNILKAGAALAELMKSLL